MHWRNIFSTFQDVNLWFFNKDTYIVPKEAPLILLDRNSVVCMDTNGKDTNHTRHIDRILHSLTNGEKCKMHKIDWCERGLQF